MNVSVSVSDMKGKEPVHNQFGACEYSDRILLESLFGALRKGGV